jgi:hypothetical protein
MEIGAPLHAAIVVEADELTAQRDADINAVAEELDHADAVYTSDLVLGRIVRELNGRSAMARLVDFGWGFSAERLVRPDVVEVDEPSIAVALLRSARASRRKLELSQVAMHALVAAVVLRLSWTRADQPDAERHQPGGKLREPAARSRANEGRADHSDTTSLPYFVLGFPNFGHLVNDEQRRVETLSTAALPAYVTQFEDFPWDGHSSPAPQMFLEADAREDGLVVGATSAMQEEISRRLFHPREIEGEPLGGFSGGPVVVVGEDGEFLLGIIKEGKPLFGTHFRVAASCWDDCFTAFGRAVAKKG